MGAAKRIRVEPIARAAADAIVQRHHYSRSVVRNSQLHLGVFLDGVLEGAMQFGPSLDKRKLVGLVAGTGWNDFIELNRMAFSDRLPRNSESRALGVAFRLLKRAYPHLGWVVSFADAAQCGDGTIYRAAGFALTGITKNGSIWELDGEAFSATSFATAPGVRARVCRASMTKGKAILDDGAASLARLREAGARPLDGFMLRYVYFLDPAARDRLTVPVLPFEEIARRGAGMYRGEKRGDT